MTFVRGDKSHQNAAAVPRTPYKPQKYVPVECDFHIDGSRLGTPVVKQAQTFALGNPYMPSVPYMLFKRR